MTDPKKPASDHPHRQEGPEAERTAEMAVGHSAPAGAEPPSTNRGVTVGIHWLSLTYFINPAKAMTHFLNHFMGYTIENEMEWSNDFYSLDRGARGYQALYTGPEGVRLYAYPHTGKHCHLEIPGELLERHGSEHALQYLNQLTKWEHDWQATRVDIAFDGVPFTPKMCHDAWRKGHTRGRMHKKSWKWQENADGKTFSMGSRQSGRYIRIYDRRGPTRLEIEFKSKWAKVVAENLATMTTKYWVLDCIGMIRNYIDFLDCKLIDAASPQGNLAPWWDTFVYGVEECNIAPTQEVRELSRAGLFRFLCQRRFA